MGVRRISETSVCWCDRCGKLGKPLSTITVYPEGFDRGFSNELPPPGTIYRTLCPDCYHWTYELVNSWTAEEPVRAPSY